MVGTPNNSDQGSPPHRYAMSELEARFLLAGNKLMEEAGKRLEALTASSEACIKGARETFNSCSEHGADIDMDALENCISTIQDGSKELHGRKDRLIAAHEDLIAVALKGEERYRSWRTDFDVPPEWKEEKWQIKPEHCGWDSWSFQLQMADLEQVYVVAIFGGALKLELMSATLARTLLKEVQADKPPRIERESFAEIGIDVERGRDELDVKRRRIENDLLAGRVKKQQQKNEYRSTFAISSGVVAVLWLAFTGVLIYQSGLEKPCVDVDYRVLIAMLGTALGTIYTPLRVLSKYLFNGHDG